MLPKKKLPPKSVPSSSPVLGKPTPARGTLQGLWANVPKPKPRPASRPKAKNAAELLTLEERDEADREEALRVGNLQLGGHLDRGDDFKDAVMRNTRGEIMRNRDGTPKLPSINPGEKAPLPFGARMKELAAQKDKDNKQGKMKESERKNKEQEANEGESSRRRGLRKHESNSVSELSPSRKIGRSEGIRQTIDADYDSDEASLQTGRRSPRKHAGTPVPRSRAGTPRSGTLVGNAKDPGQKLKRAGSNLAKDSSKTRRTISPERKVRFSDEPSTPERTVMRPNQERTPVTEIPVFDPLANFHKALISPPKKHMKPPSNANSTDTPSRGSPTIAANIAAAFGTPTQAGSSWTIPSRQSQSIAVNTASTLMAKPAQNGSPLKKVGKHARSLSAGIESPARGKRSKTMTPNTTPLDPVPKDDLFRSDLDATPSPVKMSSLVQKTTTSKKDKSSLFLSPLGDTPSPPTPMAPNPRVDGSSFTNGKLSQSHRTVVEDTDAESSDDSDNDLPMAFHNPHSVADIPRIQQPANLVTTNYKGVLPIAEKERKYKFSLKNLVASMEDNERTNESAAKVTKMMAEKDARWNITSLPASRAAAPHDGHAKLLENVVKQTAEAGGDDAQKVLKALKRANVTQSVEMVYHFFETGELKKMKHKKEYPKHFLDLVDKEGPNKLWHEMFGNRESREMGLREGLFPEMVAADKQMGEGMFYWVLDELAEERNATLRNGYLEMLLNAPVSILRHFTPDTVRTHFKTLGARKDALMMNKEMVLVLEPVQEKPYLEITRGNHWGGLNDFLELLGRTAILLSDETREYALNVILRLCADKLVRAHMSIQEAVQKALMLLSEAFETEEQWQVVSTRLSGQLYTTIPSTSLLLHLFSSIPSRARLHNLRRRLAYAFFLQNQSLLEEDIQSTFSIDKLTRHLETKKFQTSRDTKDSTYARLDSDIQLLDIALDSGSSSTAPKLGLWHLYYASLASAAMGTHYEDIEPPKLSAAEKEKENIFNEQCDTLAQRLNVILNGIQDLGPGHAERSACRATIGGLRNRVECCVRTFVRQKVRGIGGSGGGEETEREVQRREDREQARGKKFLRGFLTQGMDGEERGLDAEAEAKMLVKRYMS